MKWFKIPELIILFISFFLILVIDLTSLFSYIYTTTLFLLYNQTLDGKLRKKNYRSFHLYLLIALVIYIYQKYTIPQYLGLTGPEGGVGTDDVRFYAWIVNGNVPYNITFNLYNSTHPFSLFLKFLYPFPIHTPLNIIILNILGITFLPYYTFKLAFKVTNDLKIAELARKLILFCPFSMAMGLIIMRDAWITTFIVAGLYFFISQKYWRLLICGGLIVFIRFGFIFFLCVGILIFSKDLVHSWFHSKKKARFFFYTILIAFCIIVYALVPYLNTISNGILSDGIFRSDFLDYLIKTDKNATLTKLIFLPVWLRTPLLTLFFYFSPFLSLNIAPERIFNIRFFLLALSPIYMLFIWKSVFKTALITIFNKLPQSKISSIFWISILFALFLGTISLQVRHKTILFPYIYILGAYGMNLSVKKYDKLSTIMVIILYLAQFIFLII